MIIFLHGQDSYRIRQKLKDIINQYKKIHKSGLNLTFFDGENLKFEEFKDASRQVSMFSEKKLLVVSNIFNNQDFKEKFSKNFKDFLGLKDIILIYQDNKILGKDKLFNLLKNKAKNQEFSSLQGEKLKSWLKKEFLKFKAEISPAALNKLIDFTGNDLWSLSNEVKKLVSFRKNKVIREQDVALLIKPKIETSVFETIDALAQKNRKRALLFVRRHLDKGDTPLYLFSMINFQFRNLLIVKDLIEKNRPYYALSKETGLHPFVIKKTYQQAGKFTFQELKKIYQKIFEADLNIKTGRIAPETALDLLIAEI